MCLCNNVKCPAIYKVTLIIKTYTHITWGGYFNYKDIHTYYMGWLQ